MHRKAPELYKQFSDRASNLASYGMIIKNSAAFDQLSHSLALPRAIGETYGLIFFQPLTSPHPGRAQPWVYGPNYQNQRRDNTYISHDSLMLEVKKSAPRLSRAPYVKIITWILEDQTVLCHIERRDDTARIHPLRTAALVNLSSQKVLSGFSFTYLDAARKTVSVVCQGSIEHHSLTKPLKNISRIITKSF